MWSALGTIMLLKELQYKYIYRFRIIPNASGDVESYHEMEVYKDGKPVDTNEFSCKIVGNILNQVTLGKERNHPD